MSDEPEPEVAGAGDDPEPGETGARAVGTSEESGADVDEEPAVTGADDADPEVAGVGAGEVVVYLQWGALAFAALAVLVAGVGFYSSVSRIIAVWVSEPYQPVFRAGFNLLVLLVAGGAVAWLGRRLA